MFDKSNWLFSCDSTPKTQANNHCKGDICNQSHMNQISQAWLEPEAAAASGCSDFILFILKDKCRTKKIQLV